MRACVGVRAPVARFCVRARVCAGGRGVWRWDAARGSVPRGYARAMVPRGLGVLILVGGSAICGAPSFGPVASGVRRRGDGGG